MKHILLFWILVVLAYFAAGVPVAIDFQFAESLAKSSLAKLPSGTNSSYKFVKINSATAEEVYGLKDVIVADIEDQDGIVKPCIIERLEILPKFWTPQDVKVKFYCPEKIEKQVTLRKPIEVGETLLGSYNIGFFDNLAQISSKLKDSFS